MTINQSGVQSRIVALIDWGLFVEVGDLQIWVSAEQKLSVLSFLRSKFRISLHGHDDLELAACHTFQLTLEFVRVTTKHLYDFRILNAIEEFDSAAVIHETRDRAVECLGTKRSPDTCTKSVLRSGRLETNAVERQVINFALDGVLLILLIASVLRGLICQDLGILDKAIPFVRVKLLEILKHSDA